MWDYVHTEGIRQRGTIKVMKKWLILMVLPLLIFWIVIFECLVRGPMVTL